MKFWNCKNLSYALISGAAILATAAAADCEKATFIANMCTNNCPGVEEACEGTLIEKQNDAVWNLQAVGTQNKNVIHQPLFCEQNWYKKDAEDNCTIPDGCIENAMGYKYNGLCPTSIE